MTSVSQHPDGRRPEPDARQISTVCFRVTRSCNLACPYCQAPANGRQLRLPEMVGALRYFAEHGTARIKFTGGEPFIYRYILELLSECRSMGMEPTVVTNGTVLPTGTLECLKAQRARIKVSLHGPEPIHDSMQGRPVYDTAIRTVRRLIASGIETSVHTLLHRGSRLEPRGWIDFLAGEGVHKVSFMTFIPRGRGTMMNRSWGFGHDELRDLSETVAALADEYRGRIIVRYLDFAGKPYLVFETDGRLIWEHANEAADEPLLRVIKQGLGAPASPSCPPPAR